MINFPVCHDCPSLDYELVIDFNGPTKNDHGNISIVSLGIASRVPTTIDSTILVVDVLYRSRKVYIWRLSLTSVVRPPPSSW